MLTGITETILGLLSKEVEWQAIAPFDQPLSGAQAF